MIRRSALAMALMALGCGAEPLDGDQGTVTADDGKADSTSIDIQGAYHLDGAAQPGYFTKLSLTRTIGNHIAINGRFERSESIVCGNSFAPPCDPLTTSGRYRTWRGRSGNTYIQFKEGPQDFPAGYPRVDDTWKYTPVMLTTNHGSSRVVGLELQKVQSLSPLKLVEFLHFTLLKDSSEQPQDNGCSSAGGYCKASQCLHDDAPIESFRELCLGGVCCPRSPSNSCDPDRCPDQKPCSIGGGNVCTCIPKDAFCL